MRVEITHSEDLKQIMRNISSDRTFRTACLDSIALVSNRIQQGGEDSNGRTIRNPAPTKSQTGAYSDFYAKKRRKAGLQTAYVDQTNSGEMLDGLDFQKTSSNEYAIGFNSKVAADKAEWNEARFGELFNLTDDEVALVIKGIEKSADEAIGN
jgi:hypothetical protein